MDINTKIISKILVGISNDLGIICKEYTTRFWHNNHQIHEDLGVSFCVLCKDFFVFVN